MKVWPTSHSLALPSAHLLRESTAFSPPTASGPYAGRHESESSLKHTRLNHSSSNLLCHVDRRKEINFTFMSKAPGKVSCTRARVPPFWKQFENKHISAQEKLFLSPANGSHVEKGENGLRLTSWRPPVSVALKCHISTGQRAARGIMGNRGFPHAGVRGVW